MSGLLDAMAYLAGSTYVALVLHLLVATPIERAIDSRDPNIRWKPPPHPAQRIGELVLAALLLLPLGLAVSLVGMLA